MVRAPAGGNDLTAEPAIKPHLALRPTNSRRVLYAPFFAVLLAVAGWATNATDARAQANVDPRNVIKPLTGVKPLPRSLTEYIPDTAAAKLAAQQLGKALFWDTQVGSDGVACASCHFHAGADIRTKNQVNPGLRAVPGDPIFDARRAQAGGTNSGPNLEYSAADFPLHELSTAFNRMSTELYDTNDTFSSQGTFAGDFISSSRATSKKTSKVNPSGAGASKTSDALGNETCKLQYQPLVVDANGDPVRDANGNTIGNPFHKDGLMYRKVEPRQTPTVINAVFNYRQFWDGRANNIFNGVDPFGARTYQPRVATATAEGGVEYVGNQHAVTTGILVRVPVTASGSSLTSLVRKTGYFGQSTQMQLALVQPLIENSSLASQAVGPPLSDFEMSCGGKTFADLGRKLIGQRPLASQKVHQEDSLFSRTPQLLKRNDLPGLTTTYKALIEQAFNPKYWADTSKVVVHEKQPGSIEIVADAVNGFTQMEHNFSLFWGLAIQEYESLLISDDSPFDRGALSDEAKRGKDVFEIRGNCVACHHGPLLSGATVTSADTERPKVIENMLMNDGFTAVYDNGYYNIGARLPWDDLGVGAKDPYGFDLSFARQYKWSRIGRGERVPDAFDPKPCLFQVPFGTVCSDAPGGTTPQAAVRDAIDGTFKVPILRNVGLTPPYMHNGGQSNLRDVVHFYKRGGDRRDLPGDRADTSWFGPTPFGVTNLSNLHPDIGDKFNADDSTTNSALDISDGEMEDLLQFLLSLTDERVACHSDIFDHPELPLTMGQRDRARPGTQIAEDIVAVLPAVGKKGLGAGNCFPNSGNLFDQPDPLKLINQVDTRGLQTTFRSILQHDTSDDGHERLSGKRGSGGGQDTSSQQSATPNDNAKSKRLHGLH